MKMTFELYRDIQQYIRDNFEKTREMDFSEEEVLLLLEKQYDPVIGENKFRIAKFLRAREVSYGVPTIPKDTPAPSMCLKKCIKPILTPDIMEKDTGISSDDEALVQGVFDSLEQSKRIEAIKGELLQRDESFKDMLFRKIDELGITDAECYKRAQLTRSHFNKIKNDRDYNPKKTTVVALGMALNLPMEEFIDFVSKAGYSLAKNNAFDLIVRYAINQEIYDISEVNDILFYFDQQLLGAGYRE